MGAFSYPQQTQSLQSSASMLVPLSFSESHDVALQRRIDHRICFSKRLRSRRIVQLSSLTQTPKLPASRLDSILDEENTALA